MHENAYCILVSARTWDDVHPPELFMHASNWVPMQTGSSLGKSLQLLRIAQIYTQSMHHISSNQKSNNSVCLFQPTDQMPRIQQWVTSCLQAWRRFMYCVECGESFCARTCHSVRDINYGTQWPHSKGYCSY